MIVIVLGMSKSGTTLIAKTLHESGIDMAPENTGKYVQAKYEDPNIVKILMQMIGVHELQSLYLPEKINVNDKIIDSIKKYIKSRSGNWGIKQPYLTLCYHIWKKYLPKHIVIGIKRSREGLIWHYSRGGTVYPDVNLIDKVQNIYNKIMDNFKIPIISFKDLLEHGPVVLEKIIGRKLNDVRNGKIHLN